MGDFKREERYIVVKLKDIPREEASLRAYLGALSIPTRECVVAEQHHPHYEETWENVQRWAEGRPTIGEERDAERRDLMDERDALAADAIRFRHLVDTGAFRVMSPDMGGNHVWTGIGRPIGTGATIEDAIDAEIARRIDEGTYHGS